MRVLTPEERRRRAASFNEVAEQYDRSRPTYPKRVYDAVWRMAELCARPDSLEVGCGTGQASLALARRSSSLTCVELGADMARIARKKLSGFRRVRVVESRFEEWDAGADRFDVLFASASWHWIEPDVRYVKAASVLKPGGCIAIVESEHFYPEGFDPLYEGVQAVYGEVTGSRKAVEASPVPAAGVLDQNDLRHIEELNRTGAYDQVSVKKILWHLDRTADRYIELLGTYSDHWAMEPDVRNRLFAGIHALISSRPSGCIRKHYITTVRVARTKKVSA